MSATAAKTNGRGPRVPVITPLPEPTPTPAAVPTRSTKQLDTAVALVQASAPQLSRNALGQIGSRQYGYVTLDAIVDAVLPLLVQQGLVWKALPTISDGAPALRYRMTHIASGEYDEDVMPLCCDRTSQGLGSGITYARRYSLCAYLNLTVDPDDDGASANQGQDANQTQNALRSDRPTAAPPKQSERPATVKQRNMVKARAKAAKLEASEFATILIDAGDGAPRVWADDEAAQRWVDRALDRLPASRVDAVLEGIKSAGEGR